MAVPLYFLVNLYPITPSLEEFIMTFEDEVYFDQNLAIERSKEKLCKIYKTCACLAGRDIYVEKVSINGPLFITTSRSEMIEYVDLKYCEGFSDYVEIFRYDLFKYYRMS